MDEYESVIQWYPGHMATAMRKLDENMKLIDVVIEVIDARIGSSGSNAALVGLVGRRQRLVVMSRDDLADPNVTKAWLNWFAAKNIQAAAVNAKNQGSFTNLVFYLTKLATAAKSHTARAMVVGIPNAGKSKVINGLLRREAARVEDRAGVTRAPQWFRVGPSLELVDTPGILVPKIETTDAQWMLAMCGAIPRERFDPEEVVARFVEWTQAKKTLPQRKMIPDLEAFATARHMRRQGGELDLHNAALAYIKDLNQGKFGRISFEDAP